MVETVATFSTVRVHSRRSSSQSVRPSFPGVSSKAPPGSGPEEMPNSSLGMGQARHQEVAEFGPLCPQSFWGEGLGRAGNPQGGSRARLLYGSGRTGQQPGGQRFPWGLLEKLMWGGGQTHSNNPGPSMQATRGN